MSRLISLREKFSSLPNDFIESSQKELSKLNRTLTVKIIASKTPGQFVVFGFNEFGDRSSAGSTNGVEVRIKQSSHAQVKREMQANPFITTFCRYKSTSENISNTISYAKKDSTGYVKRVTFTPLEYLEPQDRYDQNNLIYVPEFKGLLFDGSYALVGDIEANTTITMVLTMETKIVLGKAAFGHDIIETTNATAPNTSPIINVTTPCSIS